MIEKFMAWAEQEGWVIKLSDVVLEVPEPIRERRIMRRNPIQIGIVK